MRSPIYDREVKKEGSRDITFFPWNFINKHPEHLSLYMEVPLYLLCVVSPSYLNVSPTPAIGLSSTFSALFWHRGMFAIHLRNTHIIPLSTTPCTRVTTQPHLCRGLGTGPQKGLVCAPEGCRCMISGQVQDHQIPSINRFYLLIRFQCSFRF